MTWLGRGVSVARVNATSTGDNTVVSGAAGKQMLVTGYTLTPTAGGLVTVKSSGGTVLAELQFVVSVTATTALTYSGSVDSPAFLTASVKAWSSTCRPGRSSRGTSRTSWSGNAALDDEGREATCMVTVNDTAKDEFMDRVSSGRGDHCDCALSDGDAWCS